MFFSWTPLKRLHGFPFVFPSKSLPRVGTLHLNKQTPICNYVPRKEHEDLLPVVGPPTFPQIPPIRAANGRRFLGRAVGLDPSLIGPALGFWTLIYLYVFVDCNLARSAGGSFSPFCLRLSVLGFWLAMKGSPKDQHLLWGGADSERKPRPNEGPFSQGFGFCTSQEKRAGQESEQDMAILHSGDAFNCSNKRRAWIACSTRQVGVQCPKGTHLNPFRVA